MESCDTCRFFQHTREDLGHCRRYAPRPVQWGETETDQGDAGDSYAVWPQVAVDDWCGEFEGKQ